MRFFKLKKPSKACELCSNSFEKETHLFSTIIENEELGRRDFCKSCFSKSEKPSIWWQTPIAEKPSKTILMTQYEQKLYELLIAALQEQNKSHEWVYFLAHYFKRRKVFISQGECEQQGLNCEVFLSNESQEVFLVPKSYPKSEVLKEILEELKNATTS